MDRNEPGDSSPIEPSLISHTLDMMMSPPQRVFLKTRTINIIFEMRRVLGAYDTQHVTELLEAMAQYTPPGEAWTRQDLESLARELRQV